MRNFVNENTEIIRQYAENYKCSLLESFHEWYGEGPQTDAMCRLILNELGINKDDVKLRHETEIDIQEYYQDEFYA